MHDDGAAASGGRQWAESSGFRRLHEEFPSAEDRQAFRDQFWTALDPIVPLAVDLQENYKDIQALFSGERTDANGMPVPVEGRPLFALIEDIPFGHPSYPGVNRDAFSWYQDHIGNLAGAEQLTELQHEEFANGIRDILGYRYFYELVQTIDEFQYNPQMKEQLLGALRQSGKATDAEIEKAESLLNSYEEKLATIKAAATPFLDAQRAGIDRFEPAGGVGTPD